MYTYGKNLHGDYEYIPAVGAIGGNGYSLYRQTDNGKAGINGSNRQTGGGGSGAGRSFYDRITIGKGGNGTSFSGGAGSGASNNDGYAGWSVTSKNGSDIGGEGSLGVVGSGNSDMSNYGQISLGGVGNPTGGYQTYKENAVNYIVQNGTGGLLTIYSDTFENNGKITSNGVSAANCTLSNSFGRIDAGGSSGGGSINIFYLNIKSIGTLNADGGESVARQNGSTSGKGGNGSISMGCISNGDYVSEYTNY